MITRSRRTKEAREFWDFIDKLEDELTRANDRQVAASQEGLPNYTFKRDEVAAAVVTILGEKLHPLPPDWQWDVEVSPSFLDGHVAIIKATPVKKSRGRMRRIGDGLHNFFRFLGSPT